MTITVGITTAPRVDSQLVRCVRSLQAAGAVDLRIFAEPGCDFASLTDIEIVERSRRLGAWHNWREMCCELLAKSTSPIILTVQDDTVFSRESIARLIDCWPTLDNVGFVSLYTPSHYQRRWSVTRRGRVVANLPDEASAIRHARRYRGASVNYREWPRGVNEIKTESLWGACALAFPREVLAAVIDHRIACSWKGARRHRSREPWQIANVDTAIGQIVNRLRLRMLFVNPSLAQHAAEFSTLNHGGLGGRRQAWLVAHDLLTVASGATTTPTGFPPSTVHCCGG